jgi:hypothetical protein
MHIWLSKKVLKSSAHWLKLPCKTKSDQDSINEIKIGFGLKVVPKQKFVAKDNRKK